MTNAKMTEQMRAGRGFIAALDQSGGSTPKALKLYGVSESEYSGEEQMFDLIHAMRARIIQSPAFTARASSASSPGIGFISWTPSASASNPLSIFRNGTTPRFSHR